MIFQFFPPWIKKYWLVIATFGLIVLSATLSLNQIFFFQFVDEEDNFILGHFLLSGQNLYSDLFSHHQPYAYILSALLQWVVRPQDIYDLVQIHRFFMIGWSVGWIILLVWRFREKVIVSLLIFEVIKLYVLGNLFLSEALAVYPVLYLICSLLNKKSDVKEYLWLGILIGFVSLLLAPLWPVMLLCAAIFIWRIKKQKKQLFFLVTGLVIPVIFVLPFIDIKTYFHNVFYINFKYYIPQSAEEKMPLALIKAFFSPIIILFGPSKVDTLGLILKIVWLFFVVGIGGLLVRKKYSLIGLVVLVLTLINIRYYTPYLEYKAGFHSLVWLGIFCYFSWYFFQELLWSQKKIVWKYMLVFSAVLAIIFVLFVSPAMLTIRDQKQEYKGNYGQKELLGNAIKTMRQRGDSLFVIPDEWLLYFQGDVTNHNRMVNYYGWMSLVWELNDPVVEKFANHPPAFLYCDCTEEQRAVYSDKFRQMVLSGANTNLWVRNDRFKSLSDEQQSSLRKLNFQLE
jgi:hypothetical protein